jgi:hypothetical protein
MADQAERVILEAEDQVTPVVDKANAGFDSFEKKAESVHGKVIRITDQTRSSVQRLISSMEKQAEVAGKSGVERLIAQRDQLLQRWAKEPAAIDAITRSYEKQIEVARKAAEAEAELERKRKQAEEAKVRTAAGQSAMGWVQDPFGNLRARATEAMTALGPVGGAIAGVTAGLGAMTLAGWEAAKSLGEYGVRIRDVELRTGLAAKEVGQYGFAAKATGQDVEIFERMMRGLTMAIEDDSKKGEQARSVLRGMGIDINAVRDGIVPTSALLEQIADGLSKMPTTWERNKAALDLFKRAGVEAIPVILELRENLDRARQLGLGTSEEGVQRLVEMKRQTAEIEALWDRLLRRIKEPLAVPVTLVLKWAVGAAENAQTFTQATRGSTAILGSLPVLGAHMLTDAARLTNYGASIDMEGAINQNLAQDARRRMAQISPYGGELAGASPAARAMFADFAATGRAQTMVAQDEQAYGRTKAGLKDLAEQAEKTAKETREAYFAMKSGENSAAAIATAKK